MRDIKKLPCQSFYTDTAVFTLRIELMTILEQSAKQTAAPPVIIVAEQAVQHDQQDQHAKDAAFSIITAIATTIVAATLLKAPLLAILLTALQTPVPFITAIALLAATAIITPITVISHKENPPFPFLSYYAKRGAGVHTASYYGILQQAAAYFSNLPGHYPDH